MQEGLEIERFRSAGWLDYFRMGNATGALSDHLTDCVKTKHYVENIQISTWASFEISNSHSLISHFHTVCETRGYSYNAPMTRLKLWRHAAWRYRLEATQRLWADPSSFVFRMTHSFLHYYRAGRLISGIEYRVSLPPLKLWLASMGYPFFLIFVVLTENSWSGYCVWKHRPKYVR